MRLLIVPLGLVLALSLLIGVVCSDGAADSLQQADLFGSRLLDAQKRMLMMPSDVYKNRRERQIQLAAAANDEAAARPFDSPSDPGDSWANRPQTKNGANGRNGRTCFFSAL
ncbi:hypothetical protein M3Y99_00546800 [Aphelenchoides fujianensis]|nr:hypothetical protein M3Y99_00546800 [Aphelenchoides fujianensis]